MKEATQCVIRRRRQRLHQCQSARILSLHPMGCISYARQRTRPADTGSRALHAWPKLQSGIVSTVCCRRSQILFTEIVHRQLSSRTSIQGSMPNTFQHGLGASNSSQNFLGTGCSDQTGWITNNVVDDEKRTQLDLT